MTKKIRKSPTLFPFVKISTVRKALINFDIDKTLESVQKLYLKDKYPAKPSQPQFGQNRFEIELDSPRHSYNAGDILSGAIFLGLNHSITLKGIKIKLIGEATTNWGGRVSEKCRQVCALPSKDTEHLIYTIQNVFALGSSEENPVHFSAGVYLYPFRFQLSKNLPSSFSHNFGEILYLLEASLQGFHNNRPLNVVKVVEISVSAYVDLALIPNSQLIVRLNKKRNVIEPAYCLHRGLIGFNLMLKKSAYVPGEKIPFTIHMFNSTKTSVTSITLSLIQAATFQVGTSIKKDRKTIRQVEGPSLLPGANEIWQRDNLRMHCVPATCMGKCKIIDIRYFLKVKMEVQYDLTLKGEVPIVIGSIGTRSKSLSHQEKSQSWTECSRQPKSILKKRSPST